MRVLRHYRNAPDWAKGAVIALGNFDGVHRGHRALIAQAGRIAEAEQKPLAAMVFEPYPREFFQPSTEPFRLTSFRAKARLLSDAGVDVLIVIGFDAEIAGKLAQDFVMEVLVHELAATHVVVGEDFRFGKGRGGDTTVLAYMGQMEGFGVTVFPAVAEGGEKISSSKVRAALKDGKPEEAARLLGHYWTIEGHVAHGDSRGRTLGFPTANLRLESNLLAPKYGVYAVRVRHREAVHGGAANFGIRPMFTSPVPLLEVHLFGFEGDLYGELLHVELIAWLRGEMTFADVESLKAQMVLDCAEAERVLEAMV
jgi:riboflavin kinase / FMN adenylyltransferase